LIEIVTSSPVLVAPDQSCQFELEVDASQFAIGAILWQRDPANPKKLRAVGYYSATLAPAERNYKVFDRELLGIIRALHHWSHLLCGTTLPVIIWTDHRNLLYYAEPQKVIPHAATWQVELQQYNFDLRHKPGESMKADALSRRPNFDMGNPANDHLIVLPLDQFKGMPESVAKLSQSNSTSEITLAVAGLDPEEPLDEQVKHAQDESYDTLKPWIAKYNLRLNPDNYLWKGDSLVVVENNNLRRGVLSSFHTSKTAGHPGISKTIQLIQAHYWWPNLKDFVTNYIKGCVTCQMNKINTHPTRPPLFPITSTSSLPFQTIAVDFITKLPPSYRYDTILTITYHNISKASIFLPCNESIDSVGIAALYRTHVFPHYGIPLKVISNRDPWFDSAFTTDLCKLLGIRQNISTAYHPQTDGQSEQTNQSLETYLRLYCDAKQHEWAKLLPLAQYMRNSWPSSTTKQVPFNTLIGYTPQAH
jgi:hypothetical protein